jgi:hypothetical protein
VRVTPETAVPLYLGLTRGQTLPEGTRIAAFHTGRDGEARWVYVLEKVAAKGWSALAVEPDGTLAQGDLTACLSCHEDAPADSVFGPARAG